MVDRLIIFSNHWIYLTLGDRVPCCLDHRKYGYDVHQFYPLCSVKVKKWLSNGPKPVFARFVKTDVRQLSVRVKAAVTRIVRFGENITVDAVITDDWAVHLCNRLNTLVSVKSLPHVWSFQLPRRNFRYGGLLHYENRHITSICPKVFICGVLGIRVLPKSDDVNWVYCHVSYISKCQ